jgi:hypothetical protein
MTRVRTASPDRTYVARCISLWVSAVGPRTARIAPGIPWQTVSSKASAQAARELREP